ncbi:MAG: hypothetical protein SGPRY_014558 [Prymnesium sp.]
MSPELEPRNSCEEAASEPPPANPTAADPLPPSLPPQPHFSSDRAGHTHEACAVDEGEAPLAQAVVAAEDTAAIKAAQAEHAVQAARAENLALRQNVEAQHVQLVTHHAYS